jgi:hypothetical protein
MCYLHNWKYLHNLDAYLTHIDAYYTHLRGVGIRGKVIYLNLDQTFQADFNELLFILIGNRVEPNRNPQV